MKKPSTQQPKYYFTFEGKQYYAQHDNYQNRPGLMLFTGTGIACEKAYHPELWFFYQHGKNYDQLRASEIF